MLSLSPLFTSFGWPLEDQMNHDQSWIQTDPLMNIFNPIEASDQPPQVLTDQLDTPRSSGATSSDPSNMKKLNHNASERDRRKKLNNLYSSLRSLLPGTDKRKKLSIPNMISQVLKYIPELQSQVERLIQRKEILSSISKQSDVSYFPNKLSKGCLPTVSTSRIDDGQVVVQICAFKVKRNPFSQVLMNLEGEGLQILNASSFVSSENRVFYTLHLHLQVNKAQKMECETLSKKILSFC